MASRTLKRAIAVVLLLIVAAFSWPIIDREVYQAVRAFGRVAPAWNGSGWAEARAGRFALYYQTSDQVFAEPMLAELNRRMGELSGQWEVGLPKIIPVRLHPSYQSLNQSIGWEGDSRTLGAYMLGRLELISPGVWHNELSQTEAWAKYLKDGPIVHELTHLLLDYTADGNYPVWFSEGFAQYWEANLTGYVWTEPGFRLADNVFPVEQLQQDFYGCQPEIVAYRQSLSMVEFMYSEYGEARVGELLVELRQGTSFEQAMERAFGVDLEQLDESWRAVVDD